MLCYIASILLTAFEIMARQHGRGAIRGVTTKQADLKEADYRPSNPVMREVGEMRLPEFALSAAQSVLTHKSALNLHPMPTLKSSLPCLQKSSGC